MYGDSSGVPAFNAPMFALNRSVAGVLGVNSARSAYWGGCAGAKSVFAMAPAAQPVVGFRLPSPAAPTRVLAPSVAPAAPSKSTEPESPAAKFVIGGTVTVLFEAFFGGHFLEFLKIAKQTSNDSYVTIARRITAEKGFIGTLDGFMPWGALQCLVKGAVFSFGQAQAMYLLHDNSVLGPGATTVLTGGIGGFVQGVVMSPLLLLKTRVMTDASFRKGSSAWQSTLASSAIGMRVIREEGVLALSKGMGVFAFKRFLDWTTRFAFVELVENAVKGEDKKQKLGRGTRMLCGLAGGCLSALATIPVDVTVAMTQAANKAGQKVSVIELYREKMREGFGETLRMSTRGLAARCAHVALTTMLMKDITSYVYSALYR